MSLLEIDFRKTFNPIEHEDTYTAKAAQALYVSGCIVAFLWMLTNESQMARLFSLEIDLQTLFLCIVSLGMFGIALLLVFGEWILDYVHSRRSDGEPKFIATYSFGNWVNAGVAVILATVLFLLFVGLDATGLHLFFGQASYADRLLSFDSAGRMFFIVDNAPNMEETFRWAWVPTLASLVAILVAGAVGYERGRWVGFGIAIVVVNLLFALFHGWVLETGASCGMLLYLFGVGFAFSIGNFLTKSMMFGITFHFLNNLFVYVRDQGIPAMVPDWLLVVNAVFVGLLVALAVGAVLIVGLNVRWRNGG